MAKMSVTYSGYETLRAPNEDVFTAEDKIRICRAGAAVLLQKLRDWLTANTSDPNAEVRGFRAFSSSCNVILCLHSLEREPRDGEPV